MEYQRDLLEIPPLRYDHDIQIFSPAEESCQVEETFLKVQSMGFGHMSNLYDYFSRILKSKND